MLNHDGHTAQPIGVRMIMQRGALKQNNVNRLVHLLFAEYRTWKLFSVGFFVFVSDTLHKGHQKVGPKNQTNCD
jgi:hypothetical protein